MSAQASETEAQSACVISNEKIQPPAQENIRAFLSLARARAVTNTHIKYHENPMELKNEIINLTIQETILTNELALIHHKLNNAKHKMNKDFCPHPIWKVEYPCCQYDDTLYTCTTCYHTQSIKPEAPAHFRDWEPNTGTYNQWFKSS